MRHTVIIVVVALLSGGPAALSAQQPPGMSPRTRVRVTALDLGIIRETAVVEVQDGDALVLVADSTLVIPRSALQRLDVYAGRQSHPLRGAGIGFLAGFMPMFVASHVYGWGGCMDESCFSDTSMGVLAGTFIGVGGALVGGVVGGLVWKTDRWEEVPLDQLRVQPVATPDGRIGLAVSMKF